MNSELVDTLVSRDDTIKSLEERLIKLLNVQIPYVDTIIEDAGAVAAPAATHNEGLEREEEDNTIIQTNKTSGFSREGPQNGARPKQVQNTVIPPPKKTLLH